MIADRCSLERKLKLTENERKWFDSPSSLPLLISDQFEKLINPDDPADPVRRQLVPDVRENIKMRSHQ